MADDKETKAGIFRRLSGAVENMLFSHEEVSGEQSTETAETESGPKQNASAPAVTQIVNQKIPASGNTSAARPADENLVKAILQAATELGSALADFEGYVKTFEGIIPDEASRYKAAFAAEKKTSQLTVKELLAAADEQIGALKTERADFQQGIKSKNEEVEQLKIEISHIDEKIVDLKRQIQELENSKQTKTDLTKKLADNIVRGGEKFDRAMAVVQETLTAKKNKLQMYLKNM